MEKEREVRLRRQIEELVRSRLVNLEQDISHLQREVSESFTRLLERTDASAVISESDQLLERIAAEVNAQVDQATAQSVRLSADMALLRDSVAELDQQHTQAEVLNALVARAANFAPRVVLFVVKGSNALAWAARGFEESVGNTGIRGLSVSLQADTALRAALNSQQTFYGSPEQQSDNQLIFGRLGNIRPQRELAVPLRVRSKTAAVLYADSADRGEGATNVEAIELLVQTAGLVVELVSLRSRVSEPAKQASSGQLAKSGPLPPASGPLPSATPAASGELRPSQPPAAIVFSPAAEASQPFEGRAATPTRSGELAPPSAPQAGPSSPSAGAALDEDEKQHADARRFARLLVSEIKLYNEQKVSDGRRNNDLYRRLREDIDRSRQMYDKRVTPGVSAKFDYFHDELVNTLAEGDPIKLGSDYTGPS